MKTLYRAVSKDRKHYVLLKEVDDNYVVVAKIAGERREFNYLCYNHACYKFDVIRNFIKNNIDK